MLLAESLGFVAGALVTCSLIPQLVRVFKLRSAHEISLLFTARTAARYHHLVSLRDFFWTHSSNPLECDRSSSGGYASLRKATVWKIAI